MALAGLGVVLGGMAVRLYVRRDGRVARMAQYPRRAAVVLGRLRAAIARAETEGLSGRDEVWRGLGRAARRARRF